MSDLKCYSLEEVAELFGVTYQLVYKLVKTGELPSLRIGKVFRVSEHQIQEYMNRQSRGGLAVGEVRVCARCGRRYYSSLSIVGACSVCGAPLCKACVENDHAEFCEVHGSLQLNGVKSGMACDMEDGNEFDENVKKTEESGN